MSAADSQARCSRAGRCRLVRHQSLTAASERANRLLAVVCRTTFLPFRDFPHEWVKPRKSNDCALQSGGEVLKIGLEVSLIFLRRNAVDARRPILAGPHVGFSHPLEIDDMVQREQHRSRLLPRQFDYPMPFRQQVCRVHVPSHVSWQWFSPRGASLPSFGSQRAWFPALTGTMKALRLPTCAPAVTYLIRFRRPRDPPVLCSP